MGCDIHCYVEYYDKTQDNPWVNSFSSGPLDFGRDYTLFGCLAGVRSCARPEICPRGIPQKPGLSYTSANDYYIRVISDSDYGSIKQSTSTVWWPNNQVISESMMQEEYIDKGYKVNVEQIDQCKVFADPNWHHASWLNLEELLQIRKTYLLEYTEFWSDLSKKKSKEVLTFINSKSSSDLMRYTFRELESSSLYSTISLMSALEKCNPNVVTRLVFWFDS